jgi:hypothetical protein
MDELQAAGKGLRRQRRRSLCREAVAAAARAGEEAGGSLPVAGGQRFSPAEADIIGGRRPWTVAMISSVSMPWR